MAKNIVTPWIYGKKDVIKLVVIHTQAQSSRTSYPRLLLATKGATAA